MERLVVLWCPGLSREGPRSEEARAFAEVLDLLSERCPFVEPVRLGLAALPARAPSRFFGGEEAFLSLLRDDLEMFGHRHATPLLFGIADGLFASVLAARSESIVQSGETKEFLSGFSIATLRRPELAGICQRLGLSTLGRFAGLPPERVLERFGLDGAHCQRVARGQEGELLGIRDRAILQRLAGLDEPPPPMAEATFFGGTSHADQRATRAAIRLQRRLGPSAVQFARSSYGHDPFERATLVPFGSSTHEEGGVRERSAPWPGQLPAPSPTITFSTPPSVRLHDVVGAPIGVSARGLLSGDPSTCRVEGEGRAQEIVAWAGPWPLATRWWDVRRFRVRLQVLTENGLGLLLASEQGRWCLLGRYD